MALVEWPGENRFKPHDRFTSVIKVIGIATETFTKKIPGRLRLKFLYDDPECFCNASLVWLDGIQFIKRDTVIGVTDKPFEQRMAEERATRSARNLVAHERATKTKLYVVKDNSFPLIPSTNFILLYENPETEFRGYVASVLRTGEWVELPVKVKRWYKS